MNGQGIVVALAQVNVTVGALVPNADKLARVAVEAHGRGADVVLFPEMALCGYPPEDLILKPHFLFDCMGQMERLAGMVPPGAIVVVGAPHRVDGRTYNAAFVLHGGRIAGIAHKVLLPNYGVFDEKRIFAEAGRPSIIEGGAARIGIHICEDSWVTDAAPCRAMAAEAPDLVVNISASPYHRGKAQVRFDTLAGAARAMGVPLFYCNLVGGQDELVFDGGSFAVGPDGRLLGRAHAFDEDLLLIRVPASGRAPAQAGAADRVARIPVAWTPRAAEPASSPARVEAPLGDLAEVYAALKLGLKDYVAKNGFRQVVVGLSGGIDSALVAAIAADALGPDRVAGVTMPSRYSSAETRGDAELVAKNLGIRFLTIPIEGFFGAFLQDLAPVWPDRPADITEENLQARIRGVVIMALSNKFGWLVLSTGNKSELATGYCTLYGDMCGGFALIKDVPKTLVFELARWRNTQGATPAIPPSTIDRPPTAELRANQKDSDSLPPYETLDPILERYVEQDRSFDQIVADGFDPAVVRRTIRLVDLSEYKRRQGAPGVKITPRAFGRDRRMPITNLYRERLS